jgi:hypothetical protein
MSQDSVPPLPKSSSNVNGCLLGCLVVLVVGVLGVGILAFTFYKTMEGALTAYTEEAPRELPALTLSEEQSNAAHEKIAQFEAALDSGTGPREFSFTGDELNVMLRSSEPGQFFGESIYVTVANSEVRGEVSFDLGTVLPFLDGRYANGSATFSVFTEGGILHVYADSFQVKGEAASEEFMQGMRGQNLALEFADDPEFRAWIEKIESIRVEGDHLIVTLVGGSVDGAVAAPEEPATTEVAPVPAPEENSVPEAAPVTEEVTTPPSI